MDETIILDFFGIPIGLNVLFASIVTVIIVMAFCYKTSRHLSVEQPGKIQLLTEKLFEFVDDLVEENFGKDKKGIYVVIALTLMLFIFVANILGLVFLIEPNHVSLWKSPTADLSVALTLSVLVNALGHILGIQKFGLLGYVKKNYGTPNIMIAPIKIIENLINVLTLALRLFGNIFAGEVLLKLIAQLGNLFGLATWPIGIPIQVVWQGFSTFIGAIQAYIFVTLAMVYLSEKLVTEEEEN